VADAAAQAVGEFVRVEQVPVREIEAIEGRGGLGSGRGMTGPAGRERAVASIFCGT
jgi:hypothetical protein